VVLPLGCDTEIYFYRIHLTVTDPHGLATQRTSEITPDCSGNIPLAEQSSGIRR
jgi:hypothetical protein